MRRFLPAVALLAATERQGSAAAGPNFIFRLTIADGSMTILKVSLTTDSPTLVETPMRWTQRALMLSVAFAAVTMLTAPNGIFMTVTPNPGGAANKLKGNGDYVLDQGYMFGGVSFQTTLKGTTQVTSASANVDTAKKTWEYTLQVAAGTYNPTRATLTHVDAQKKVAQTFIEAKDDQIVK